MLHRPTIALAIAVLFLEIPSFPQNDAKAPKPVRAGVNGVGVPICVYCPIPKAKTKQTVVMQAVITINGQATDLLIIKGDGGELEKKAIEAVRGWRFKAAHDADGHPVATLVPIEVTSSSK